MKETLELLRHSDFPSLRRAGLETLQVNVGYLCNQQCQHCHVDAGPRRTEIMDRKTVDTVLEFLDRQKLRILDLTGGAPEMNPHFRELVTAARDMGVQIIDRCNLTILEEPGYEWLADFLADNEVNVVASLPCYLKENVDRQRGSGVFDGSIRGLRKLNMVGYASSGGLKLDLVYNPQGPSLPPEQHTLEKSYRKQLQDHFNIEFNHLLTIANMPIKRFGSMLISKGEFSDYMELLKQSHQDANLDTVMCRTLISVDWQGDVYDCDFNQMLGLHSEINSGRANLRELMSFNFDDQGIVVMDHCYGCTAGQGSSCSGALTD